MNISFLLQANISTEFYTIVVLKKAIIIIIPTQIGFVEGILFSRCRCVHICVRWSKTFCSHNILKNHCWKFIKPCKHIHIYKTNI